MKWAITLVALALLSAPAAAATFDENGTAQQFAHTLISSDQAVACRLRTSDWRKSVILGLFASARLALMSEHPEMVDDELNAEAVKIIQAAKMQAALDTQFAAPTQTQCEALNASHDMQSMDAAAKIGLLFSAANGQ
jgi:hypothetical protein